MRNQSMCSLTMITMSLFGNAAKLSQFSTTEIQVQCYMQLLQAKFKAWQDIQSDRDSKIKKIYHYFHNSTTTEVIHQAAYQTVYYTFCPLIDINDPAFQLIVCDVHFRFHGLQVMQLALQGYCGLQTQMTMKEIATNLTIVDKDCKVPSLLENHIKHWLNIQYTCIYVDYHVGSMNI